MAGPGFLTAQPQPTMKTEHNG